MLVITVLPLRLHKGPRASHDYKPMPRTISQSHEIQDSSPDQVVNMFAVPLHSHVATYEAAQFLPLRRVDIIMAIFVHCEAKCADRGRSICSVLAKVISAT